MQVMKIEDAKKRLEYLRTIAPMSDQRFEHMTADQWKAHLEYVEKHKQELPF